MQVYYYPPGRSKEELTKAALEAATQREQTLQRARAEEVRQRNMEGERARLAKKAAQYIGVEARHAWGGPAPAAVFEERMRLCLACPGRVDELDGMRDDGGVGFCTKCGCGANQRSRLSVKLTLAGVACPLKKFPAVSGTGGTIASAVEAAKGVAASAINLMRKNLAADR